MPKYPVRQADLLALAEAMIGGYIDQPGLFPNADAPLLQSVRDAYYNTAAAQTEAIAKAQLATEAKQTALAQLQAVMRCQLKQSQVDTAADPENLNYIGWGPKATARSIEAPGQPMRLKSVDEGAGTLRIEWKHPVRSSGGLVVTYAIERRELTADRTGDWKLVSMSLETTAALKNQPRGPQLEYRIKAVNKAGQSEASNTIAVVL